MSTAKMSVPDRFRQDMANVQQVVKLIADRKTLPGGMFITLNVLSEPHFNSPSQKAVFSDSVNMSVQAIPALEIGLKLGANAQLAGDIYKDSVSAPIIFRDLSNEDSAERFRGYEIKRTGGRDAKPEPLVRTLDLFVKETLEGYPGYLVGEITVVLPAPQVNGMYTPNFAFKMYGVNGEHSANLIVDDRLISATDEYLIPKYRMTYLMDYSNAKDLHLLEARSISVMDTIETAALRPNFNYSVIVLRPVKEKASEKLMMIHYRPPPNRYPQESFDRSPMKTYEPRVDVSDAQVNTGAASGLAAGRVEREPDFTRSGVVILVRTMVARFQEDLMAASQNLGKSLGLILPGT